MAQLLAEGRRVDRGFERLYRRHVADVYHYALAVLRNPADAEDVTQTTFLNALRAYDRGERPNAPRNWLIAIAHNVCRQRFRQSARRPNEVALDEELAEAQPENEGPSARAPARVLRVLDVRPLAARPAIGAEGARRRAAAGLARLVLRRRRRRR